ncbi:alpha/beta hydrolase fold domain-containing protein [Gluconacetobacter azotocaptans]|uniref:Alpha/beta hydrolase fold domain-containing protein n=1 Tax=Gluconacetobacter azotocaptans TaxID=142834 RepID=A0A7W4JSM4_9PROT|nr:alpha/beta hydrolase fold domain-containing protein [Gluconacetobacter azotocaptans]MBB2190117.1 alpha/beta hydrolase fold domain-containing protein [Gluconacetobacter azotocaptans]GBQ26210.1 esterase [Gluconacetobacter azotocaptans DSM 13594]
MSVSWSFSPAALLRQHHARDAAQTMGPLPDDVTETPFPPSGLFRGGLMADPHTRRGQDVIVYFHGGGFIAGGPETHRHVTAWLAHMTGLRVLSARYRLVPEHPFPAQADDAVAACRAMLAVIGEDAGIFLAGDSAGACVSLWGLHRMTVAERQKVRGLILFYGGYGQVESESITRRGTAENGLDSGTLSIMYDRLRGAGPEGNPVWPTAFASRITQPAYVVAAERDAIFDDSIRLFHAIEGQNPHSRLVIVPDQDHSFLKGAGQDPTAQIELARASTWIGTLTAQGPLSTPGPGDRPAHALHS